MAWAAAAVVAMLFAFGMGAAGLLADTAMRAQREVAAAQDEQADLGRAQRTGAIAVAARSWTVDAGEGILELWVGNTGGEAFDALRVDVLLDGALRTGSIAARAVEGQAATRVWAPGEVLHLRLEGLPPAEPARAWVVAETGAAGVG